MIEEPASIRKLLLKKGVASDGTIYIKKIRLNQLIFDNFINNGIIEITGIEDKADKSEKNLLSIINSNLDNVVFKNVHFESFEIIIRYSKLNNISTIDEHFPISEEVLGNMIDSNGNLKHSFKIMSEIYNQLYISMQKQGYKPLEMAYYATYLDWERKAAKKDKKWGKFLSLELHNWSTRFGQSWERGLMLSLIIGLLCFEFFLLFHESLPENLDLSKFIEFYTQFLLPTHKLDYINPKEKVGWVSAIFDILGRVALAYMYYQTITAFRRFGRK